MITQQICSRRRGKKQKNEMKIKGEGEREKVSCGMFIISSVVYRQLCRVVLAHHLRASYCQKRFKREREREREKGHKSFIQFINKSILSLVLLLLCGREREREREKKKRSEKIS